MRRILCDGGKAEDVCHFILRCNEFEWERRQILARIKEWNM